MIFSILHIGEEVYNGDPSSFWMDIFVNCIGAFFGFGLSLLIYAHSVKKDKRKELQDAEAAKKSALEAEETAKKNLLKYFVALITKNVIVAKKDLDLVDEYIEEQKKDYGHLGILKRVPSHDFTRLINIDNKGVFEAWVSAFPGEDSIKEYQRTNSAIDTVEGMSKEVHRMHLNVIEKGYDRLFEVKRMIDHLPDRLSAIISEIETNAHLEPPAKNFVNALKQHRSRYSELVENGVPLSVFENDFVLPLLTFFVDLNTVYSMEMILLCKRIRVQFHDVKTDVESLVKDFGKIREKVKEAFEILETTVQKIQNNTV